MFVRLGLVMLLFMLERTVKFSRFFLNRTVGRTLWYVYYIPLLLFPLLSLMVALWPDKTDNENPNHAGKFLYLPAGLLSVVSGALANPLLDLAEARLPENRDVNFLCVPGAPFGGCLKGIRKTAKKKHISLLTSSIFLQCLSI